MVDHNGFWYFSSFDLDLVNSAVRMCLVIKEGESVSSRVIDSDEMLTVRVHYNWCWQNSSRNKRFL